MGSAEAQHFLRCIVQHEMFRRIPSQADGVERQFLLDRMGKLSAGTSEHEFDRIRVGREWGRAAKATLRVKGALGACRLRPVPCDGYVDNDSLCITVSRGSSAKLRHLRVHADTCFRFLALHIMTKVLTAIRHRDLCKTNFDLDGVPVASIMADTALC